MIAPEFNIGLYGLSDARIITINHTVDYMARGYACAISGPKTGSTFNRTLPMPRVMSIPRIKIIKPSAI